MKKRLELTIDEELIKKIESDAKQRGFTKSEQISFLINDCKDNRPEIIKQSKLVAVMSDIDISLRAMIAKDVLTDEEKMKLFEYAKDIRAGFSKYLQKG